MNLQPTQRASWCSTWPLFQGSYRTPVLIFCLKRLVINNTQSPLVQDFPREKYAVVKMSQFTLVKQINTFKAVYIKLSEKSLLNFELGMSTKTFNKILTQSSRPGAEV